MRDLATKELIRHGEQLCAEQGYKKCGANWYRSYGEGLLQVVTFQGIPERVNKPEFHREPAVTFQIISLYDQIPWITIPVLGAKRSVIPNVPPSIFSTEGDGQLFFGTAYETECMIKYGLPLLNRINTHAGLASLLERIDIISNGSVRANDSNKVIPYLLSGQTKKLLTTIDAIEGQNRAAYLDNCQKIPRYNTSAMQQKFNDDLAPLILMRNCIHLADSKRIADQLQNNYRRNLDIMSRLGIKVQDTQLNDTDLIKLMAM